MTSNGASKRINVAIAGLGNCAASFIEGLCFYRRILISTQDYCSPLFADIVYEI